MSDGVQRSDAFGRYVCVIVSVWSLKWHRFMLLMLFYPNLAQELDFSEIWLVGRRGTDKPHGGSEWQESRRKYWATRVFIRSFARTTHSIACSALLAFFARCAALIRLLARSLTHSLPSSWESEWLIVSKTTWFWPIARPLIEKRERIKTERLGTGFKPSPCSRFLHQKRFLYSFGKTVAPRMLLGRRIRIGTFPEYLHLFFWGFFFWFFWFFLFFCL